MENYIEWNNNKIYEGHVRRLTQIKTKQNKVSKNHKNFRIKSQPSKSQTNIKKNFFPLPLVSKNQRLLLGSVVKQKTINLRQKQSLLENYMLSKRILQTNSVFDSKLLKKQFNFHRKVSENMNRSLKKNRSTFSQLRKKRNSQFYQGFSQLQNSKEQNHIGMGNIFFKIKIKEIMLIKRILEQNNNSRFNLIFKPQKFKSYSINALTFTQLCSKQHALKATEKQSTKKNGLKFEIEQVRGNEIHKLCEFRLHLKFQENVTAEQQNHSFVNLNPQSFLANSKKLKVQKKDITRNQVQKLTHPTTKFLIGTIEYMVKYHSVNLQEE